MIRPVDITAAPADQAKKAAQATSGGASFAAVHSAALKKTATGTSPAVLPGAPPAALSDETWAPVPGVSTYAKIASGDRAGQYIDLSKGKLHGQAFTIEQRGGKTVHVYKGADGKEQVVSAGKEPGKARTALADAPPKGEKWAPIAGHSGYADILGGKRDGLYVNTSGGERAGMAFQLVRKGDKMLHIYGEGKDRQVIAVPVKGDEKASPKAATPTPAPKATGGASATTK